MINIIKSSFSFEKLFGIRKYKSFSFIIYFIIMILLSSVPQNFAIIKNEGFEFNKIVIELDELAKNSPDVIINSLPNGSIEKTMFINEESTRRVIQTKTFKIMFIVDEENYDIEKNLVVFEKDKVVYYGDSGQKLEGKYTNLNDRVNLTLIKSKILEYGANHTEIAQEFNAIVRSVFSHYFIAQGVMMTLVGNIVLNTLLLFIICAILLLVRINFKKVATYKEYLKIYIASFTIPVLIGVILGLISYKYLGSFSQVIIQWGTPCIAVGGIYLGSKRENKNKEKKAAKNRRSSKNTSEEYLQ